MLLKQSLILLFLFSITIGFAQQFNPDQRITIVSKGKPLSDVLTDITNKTQIKFSFSNDQLDVTIPVTLTMRNKPIKDIFEKLFKNMGLEYVLIENQVVLKVPKNKPDEVSVIKSDEKYTVCGYLKDKETGEILIGASIYVNGTKTGLMTNNYGFYSLTLPKGDYVIVFSCIGFETQIIQVDLNKNKKLNVELKLDNSILQEVIISAEQKEEIKPINDLSRINIHPRTVSEMPGFMGETELIKSLQSVPGIKTFGDGSAIFYVRGGNRDQNMILIDDAPVYNPSHLFGFFTSFIPDAIKDIKLYKGDMPISMGGGISSVIDITCNDGNMNQFGINGSIGLITNRISLETPIKKEKSSLFISSRQSHLEWYLPKNMKADTKIGFGDFHLKFNYKLNDNNRLYFSGYWGTDDYNRLTGDMQSNGIKWTNSAVSIRWSHVFNAKLFSHTTIYSSVYNYYLYLGKSRTDFWNTYIANATFKNDYIWYANAQNTIRFGFNMTGHYFNPGNLQFGETQKYLIPAVPMLHARYRVLYGGNEQKINDKLQLKYGLRLNVWKNVDSTTTYIYDSRFQVIDSTVSEKNKVYHKYYVLEPRISLDYKVKKDVLLSITYNRNCQFLQLLSNSLSPFTTLEVWYPAGPNIKPQKANQISVGLNKSIKENKYRFSVDCYSKWLRNQIGYTEHANMLLNKYIEGELRPGKSNAYGIETMFKKVEGKLNGWISYTFSRVIDKNTELNHGNRYPAMYDRPHDFTFVLNYKTDKRWQYALEWIYATGSPFTSPVGFYMYQGSLVPLYNKKNNDRLPDYHRLDISATVKLNKTNNHRYRHNLTFSVYNLYNRKNPIAINFNKIKENGNYVIPTNVYLPHESDPTYIYLVGIVPSITYSFKF